MKKKLKRYLTLALAWFLYYSGLIRLWVRYRHCDRHGNSICVLGLHRVLHDADLKQSNSLPGIVLRQSTFAQMVRFLHHHYAVITLGEFLSLRSSTITFSKLPCLLTFDDGWADNFTTALPLLEKYNMPAVIFAVTGLIGTNETFWVEQVSRIYGGEDTRQRLVAAITAGSNERRGEVQFEEIVEKLKHMPSSHRQQILGSLLTDSATHEAAEHGDRLLTWNETRALQDAGVEIEAHTATHPLLVYEDDESVRWELNECKRVLELELGKPIRAFAYPNGTWDERVRKMVVEAGYECAFTTERGWYRPGSDRFAVRRIMLHEGMVTGPNGKFSPALLSLRLSGLI